MFAQFAEKGLHIVMTANINSSQLLKRLGKRCGRENMTLHRMTSWRQLSDVQRDEEKLFEEAFDDISSNLG